VLSVGRLGRQVAARGARFGGATHQPRTRLILAITAAVAVAAGFGVYALTRGMPPANPPIGGVTRSGPFRVVSVTPAPGARQADGSQPVRVTFSAPLAAGSPLPSLTPSVAGSWHSAGDTLMFTPSLPLHPSTRITVTVPAGKAGVRSAAGRGLAQPTTAQFTTAAYTPLRLAQMLAQLGYLPVSWQPPYLGMRIASELDASAAVLAGQEALAYDPPQGTFTWDQGYPAALASMWQPDNYNVILRGAVMAFQSEHDTAVTGDVDDALWDAVFRADSASDANANGYTYAVASQVDPETLTIYHDGQVVLQSPANTGIPASPTVDGTFPVYLKYRFQIMSGTNPDGSSYADPVSFVSYFNGGDAVHYFPRGGYGYQQSLGCVELPYGAAEQAYPYLTYGSLVTVTG